MLNLVLPLVLHLLLNLAASLANNAWLCLLCADTLHGCKSL
ncbi:hypothetical protein GCHA_4356 [Paraglaciecola chathamensis S18K6]|uniref:Uncharacterized protein n=1 Tax=Paraglaciecola chathamensis S18K6 TaxID=1127672 RepID=A0AAV3V683_9ALTE|nr:hypothetical protein GCHA_4356 [Paraglaciecola chathamensis S18K6]